ncbi:RHS repeat-associated core domain-containing protein [Sorangium sp. So ce119]|uniref:RHS repeat-associated core domain-containing protein n=1 Tax=Sorangium sp. So ce119 TaxID=3133279 RepID=UPI003F648CB6
MARTAPVPNIPAIPGMNPGVFVAGGGGAGGGGRGKGGSGRGGDQRAGGKNGNADPGGGGKSTKGCSPGANGGCTNCSPSISRGDPVDVISGEVFTIPETDLSLPGFFNLEITRSYSSARRDEDVGLGFGWRHSLAWTLEETRRGLVLRAGDGGVENLPALDAIGDQASAGPWGILRTEVGYLVRPGSEFIHYFAKTEPTSSLYRLVAVSYRARGWLRLSYEAGRLTRVMDSAGRAIVFEGTREGRIRSISVPDPNGSSIAFVRFEYDARGDLIEAVDADGYSMHYGYDEHHRLQRLEYPSGIVFHFVYDDEGRCVETWGSYPGHADPALALEAPAVLHDGHPAKGIYHCRFVYDGDYTEVVDSVRLQRFFGGPSDEIGKAVSARGGVTTRTYDDRDRMTSLTDPTGAMWTWQYDDMNAIVRETNPDGQTIHVRRDALGRELEVIDPAGGGTTIGRERSGEIVYMRDQTGGLIQFNHVDRGIPREIIDERGGRHLFEYDHHGNCTARTFPNGARYQFSYDYWGRLLRVVNPLGHETHLRYTRSGRLTHLVDQLGRTTNYRYDGMGNLASLTEANGSTTTYEYGGLNWLTRVVHPDGSELRAYYNREGWLLYHLNERGEKSERSYLADGNLSAERQFHGTTIRYQRDLLGRITGYDEGDGPHELKLSPAGQILEHIAPDGSVQRFEYDARGELMVASSVGVEITFERDAAGRITKESVTVEGAMYVVQSWRNESGDRLTLRTSLGHELRVKRDANGRVAALEDRDGRILSIARSPLGSVQRIDLADGGAIIDARDAANRLRRRHVERPREGQPRHEPERIGADRGGTVEHRYEYTDIDELRSMSTSAGQTDVFEYDARKRLVCKQRSDGRREDFYVDSCSNYSEINVRGLERAYTQGNVIATRGNTQYIHDARGYLITKIVRNPASPTPETWRYSWNAYGLLESVDRPDGLRVEFLYDAFARRVAKRTLRDGRVTARYHYVWDLMSLIHEVKVSDSGGPESVRTYLFEDAEDSMPLGHRDGSGGAWVYYVEDVIGTPTDLVDATGQVLGRLERSVFGKARPTPGSQETTLFRYPGQYEDSETGLHYNRYRYYDPEIGRYISPDPIGYFGGLNLFAYGPNPIGWPDPLGLVIAQLTGAPAVFQNFAGNPGGFPSGGVTSPGLNAPPVGFNPRNNGCGEQKFAQELLAFGKTQQARDLPRRQRKYKLEGKFPPCPTCHAALMRAAADTNSTVEYMWEQPEGVQNKVSYKGSKNGSCKVKGKGAAGKEVATGYDHDLGPAANRKATTTQGYYGVAFSSKSDATYEKLRQQQKSEKKQ